MIISFLEGCEGVGSVVSLIKKVVQILQLVIPAGLIAMGTVDMGRAVIAGDEKKIKERQKPFVSRLIAAIIVFLIPFIVNFAINLIANNANGWVSCWKNPGEFEKIDVVDFEKTKSK